MTAGGKTSTKTKASASGKTTRTGSVSIRGDGTLPYYQMDPKIYIRTPLMESVTMRKYSAGRKVYLKLENCQPSASFKLRGLSNLCRYAISQGYERFVCFSGGNAGLAAAFSASRLGMPCHIVVGTSTPECTKETIRSFGATVEVYGSCCEESMARANELLKADPKAFLIHPFDHPAIWDGHSSIIDEVHEQLEPGVVPSMIVTCCGGGGLINGLVQGCRRYGWTKTKVLAMESYGCHSLNVAVKNDGKMARLDKITSIVTCLSINQVCQKILDDYHIAKPPILSRLVTDGDAAEGCLRFAEEHRMLVGLACGTCLAALYRGFVQRILTDTEDEKDKAFDKILIDENGNPVADDPEVNDGPVVVIICGGAEISLKLIEQYQKDFNLNIY